jgi:hypothetical protein
MLLSSLASPHLQVSSGKLPVSPKADDIKKAQIRGGTIKGWQKLETSAWGPLKKTEGKK